MMITVNVRFLFTSDELELLKSVVTCFYVIYLLNYIYICTVINLRSRLVSDHAILVKISVGMRLKKKKTVIRNVIEEINTEYFYFVPVT